jgi:hypothetical protein
MGRTSSSRASSPRRRTRPMLERLEERRVPSHTAGELPIVPDSSPATGEFLHNFQQFNYTNPDGTHVAIKIIGVGSLEGTTVDSSGALHLLYSKTNAYTRILSNVHGGTGQANLASIYSRDLLDNHAETSLSGIGASLLRTINLPQFNLIAGGVINVSSGIANLNLNTAGPNTQINLRVLPTSDLTTFQTANSNEGVTANTNPTNSNTSSSTTTSTSSGTTVGTSSNNNSSIVVTGAFLVQSLAGINGEFTTAGNIINVSSPGTPGPPPAPPGLVLKINHINGNIASAPDLLTDNEIFGYDPTTGQVLRFNLTPENATASHPNMASQTGTLDPTWTPLQVQPPGSTTPVAISVGRDGTRLVLLVSTGSVISVYDATYGTPLGSFTTPAGFDADTIGSTDTLTVIGDVATNQLQMIDVPLSLAAGTAQPPVNEPGYPPPSSYTPPAGFSLVGGLTGVVGTNQVFPTVAAVFNSFQPNVTQLGLLTASTSTAETNPAGGLTLVRQFSTVSEQAILSGGSNIPVNPSNNPMLTGVPLGSVDSTLALNTIGTTSTPGQYSNSVKLLGRVELDQRGTITLDTTDPITDLSESFRPDLNGSTANGTGPVLIDVQGDIQSLRGTTATGLVLNNTGYLNLIRIGQISNSTILAQPIGHIYTPIKKRSNDVLLISTDNRDFGHRGGVDKLVAGLYQLGPLSLTNDSPNP